MIIATASLPSDPNLVDERWKFVSRNQDKRSFALTEVNVAKMEFVSGFRKGDGNYISGEKKLFHLQQENRILYGRTVFQGLWDDWIKKGRHSALEFLYEKGEIVQSFENGCEAVQLSFFGDVLLDPASRHRCVLVLSRYDRSDDDNWRKDVYWLDFEYSNKHLVAVSPLFST